MTRFLRTDTIVRIRAPRVLSGHGGTKLDWANATRVTIDYVRVVPLTSEEREGRPTITDHVIGDIRIDLAAEDRVETVNPVGLTIVSEVDGPPIRRQGLTAAVAHSVTELKAVDL